MGRGERLGGNWRQETGTWNLGLGTWNLEFLPVALFNSKIHNLQPIIFLILAE
jgi:hypothetical protein